MGSNNSSWSFQETINAGDTWVEQKSDSRDLLGGVVNIKTTFANFLDFWPEYSTVKTVSSNVVQVLNFCPTGLVIMSVLLKEQRKEPLKKLLIQIIFI